MRNIIVGIDVGTYATRVVITEKTKGDEAPKILATGMSETKGLRHGYIVNMPEAVKSIKRAVHEAEKASGIEIKRAIVSAGGVSMRSETSVGMTVVSKADSELTTLDIEKTIKEAEENLPLANKRIVYMAPIAYKLDGKEVLGRPEGMHGARLETKVLFVTCLTQHLDDLETAFLEAGIEVVDLVPSALAEAQVILSDKQRTVGSALIDVGSETTTLAVFENNMLVWLHAFSIGGTDITNDIALGLKIPLEEAEGIKIGSVIGNYPKKKLDEIIEARLDDIFELVETDLKKIKRSGLLPAGVLIGGGSAQIALIEPTARALLKLPARIATGEMPTSKETRTRDAVWFVAYGLTAFAAGGSYPKELGSLGELGSKIKDFFKRTFGEFRP